MRKLDETELRLALLHVRGQLQLAILNAPTVRPGTISALYADYLAIAKVSGELPARLQLIEKQEHASHGQVVQFDRNSDAAPEGKGH